MCSVVQSCWVEHVERNFASMTRQTEVLVSRIAAMNVIKIVSYLVLLHLGARHQKLPNRANNTVWSSAIGLARLIITGCLDHESRLVHQE